MKIKLEKSKALVLVLVFLGVSSYSSGCSSRGGVRVKDDFGKDITSKAKELVKKKDDLLRIQIEKIKNELKEVEQSQDEKSSTKRIELEQKLANVVKEQEKVHKVMRMEKIEEESKPIKNINTPSNQDINDLDNKNKDSESDNDDEYDSNDDPTGDTKNDPTGDTKNDATGDTKKGSKKVKKTKKGNSAITKDLLKERIKKYLEDVVNKDQHCDYLSGNGFLEKKIVEEGDLQRFYCTQKFFEFLGYHFKSDKNATTVTYNEKIGLGDIIKNDEKIKLVLQLLGLVLIDEKDGIKFLDCKQITAKEVEEGEKKIILQGFDIEDEKQFKEFLKKSGFGEKMLVKDFYKKIESMLD